MTIEEGLSVPIGVVVVAFHRPGQLATALGALRDPLIDVVVVNVEADRDVAAVTAAAGVRAIEVGANVGYAAAVNLGVAAVRADTTLFMNDDVVVSASAVHALVTALTSSGSDVTVPAVVDPDGTIERTITAPPTLTRLLLEWCCLPDAPVPVLRRLLRVEKWRLPNGPEPIPAAAAVAVCTRTVTLLQHPLPEVYWMYWEDAEWFSVLRSAGLRVTYHPDVRVTHAGGRADVRPEKSALLARNAVLCVRRTQGMGRAATAWMIVVLWQLRLFTVDGLRALLGGGTPNRLTARRAGLRSALAAWKQIA